MIAVRLRNNLALIICLAAAAGVAAVYASWPEARPFFRKAIGVALPSAAQKEDGPPRFPVAQNTIRVPRAIAERAGVKTLRLEPVAAPETLTLTGRTGFNLEAVAHVHTQLPGRLITLGPALGSFVEGQSASGPGDLLCQIESADLSQAKSDYLKARVQTSVDEDTLARTRELLKSGVLSDKSVFDAENAVRRSVADLEAARQRLLVFGLREEDLAHIERQSGRARMVYDVRAPRSGVIAEKNITLGELADTSVNLFTIADMSTLWIWGDVYERDWAKVRVGQDMEVEVAGGAGDPIRCRIDWISPVIDGASRSVRIRGTAPNQERRLLADMYATLRVTTGPGAGSLVLPKSATVRRGQDAWAFVLAREEGDDLVFERRPVSIAAIDGAGDRALAGLAAGDVVVTSGAINLHEQMSR